MKNQLLKLKQEKAQLVSQIIELKSKRKELKGYVPGLWNAQFEYRVKHMAHCLLRGKTMDQVESNYRNPSDSTHNFVRHRAQELADKLQKESADEALRAGA